jgi:hypothetical protein
MQADGAEARFLGLHEPATITPSANIAKPVRWLYNPLHRTLPGRAIVVGVAIKLAVFAVRLVGVPCRRLSASSLCCRAAIDRRCTAHSAVSLARRRLLWRVRRLILHIFTPCPSHPHRRVASRRPAVLQLQLVSGQGEVRSLNERVPLRRPAPHSDSAGRRTRGPDILNRLQRGLQPEFVPQPPSCPSLVRALQVRRIQSRQPQRETRVQSCARVRGCI